MVAKTVDALSPQCREFFGSSNCLPEEEKPIGLLLCSEGNTEHIELLMLDEKEIKVAQYLTELPSKQWFADKLHRALEIVKMNKEL
jgi:hypothetical protein